MWLLGLVLQLQLCLWGLIGLLHTNTWLCELGSRQNRLWSTAAAALNRSQWDMCIVATVPLQISNNAHKHQMQITQIIEFKNRTEFSSTGRFAAKTCCG
jgi:Flp pilus assembly protein CpaB